MKTFSTKSKTFKIIAAIGALVFWVGLWQFASYKINDPFFMPSPYDVMQRFGAAISDKAVLSAVASSLAGVVKGYVIGVLAGVFLAFVTTKVRVLYALFSPALSVIRATPVVSIIIVAFLLLNRSAVPVYIVIMMVLPIVWANVSEGIENIDRKLLEMTRVYGFGFFKRLKMLYLPSVLPYFTSAAITAFGLAWKSGIAAEIICYPENSLGKLIYNARVRLDTAEVFAITLIVIVISIILEQVLKLLLSKGRKVSSK